MTIKRRLYISNVLMLILPIVISICIIGFMAFAAIDMLGIWQREKDTADFYDVVDEVTDYTDDHEQADMDEIIEYIQEYSAELEEMQVSVAIYKEGEPVYSLGRMEDIPLYAALLAEQGEHYLEIDNTSLYRTELDGHVMVVAGEIQDIMSRMHNPTTYKRLGNLALIAIAIIVAVVYVTNRMLTRMVIKSIINPLDTLVYGVHQIRDGNLDYRIHYTGKDEFAPVCEDFNEMAQRLMDMVNARQKDDENRRELIAGMSHDLRTPLTSIKAYVEGLEKGVASTPQLQRKYIDTIKSKTEDLEHIVSQLFLFSKMDLGDVALNSEAVDVGAELEEFVRGVAEEYAGKGLRIELTENVYSLMARVDSVQLRNVYTNLLENSVKYCDAHDPAMRVSCLRDGMDIYVVFEDNGPGVPDEKLDRIFDVFYRGDKARSNTGKGSGLGLAISARIMKLMGGGIQAENTQGGLRITLQLPIMREQGHEENTHS